MRCAGLCYGVESEYHATSVTKKKAYTVHNTRNNDSNITVCGKNNVNYNTFMNYFKFVCRTNYNSFKTTTYVYNNFTKKN